MSDFVNDNIDALINSLEKTGHKNKANSDALKNSLKQEQNHQNSDEKLESSQNRSRECSIRTDATKIKEHLSYLWLWQKLVMVKSILVKT
ncbi:unknown [Succinatimonas sp. CAG:777]|nr:unknown [Succinatimonas sp. CAG:777]